MGLFDLKDLPPEESEQFQKMFLGFFLFPLLFGYLFVKNLLKKNPFLVKRINPKQRALLLLEVSVINFVVVLLIRYLEVDSAILKFLYYSILLTIESSAVFFLFSTFLFKNELNFRLTEDLLKKRLSNINVCEKELLNPACAPVGLSYGWEDICALRTEFRNQHLMITGGSGLGKTSLAITLIRHDILWNRPVIFIDPKGDQDDIDAIKHYAKLYNREQDVLVFSIVNEDIFYYDPLKEGTPSSKAEKILQILNIEHDYYRSVADNILQIIFTIYDYKNERISINALESILLSKERLQALFDDAIQFLPQINDKKEKDSLLYKINAFKNIKQDEIMGIQSKISSINNRETRKKINPSREKQEISIRDAIDKNKIIIFDIKAGQYAELAAAIGRFLMKDLFIIGQEIQSKRFNHSFPFIPIYFDEFHSFVNEGFASFISMARSANFGLTLMFQTIAGMDVINEHLRHQLNTNIGYSLHFRGNAAADLDFVAQTCGTEIRKENSNQIDQNSLFKRVTGMGTEFNAEVFKISPNLIRALDFGQFVLYKRNEKEIHIVEAWHGKKEKAKALRLNALKQLVSKPLARRNSRIKTKNRDAFSARINSIPPDEQVKYVSYSDLISINRTF